MFSTPDKLIFFVNLNWVFGYIDVQFNMELTIFYDKAYFELDEYY